MAKRMVAGPAVISRKRQVELFRLLGEKDPEGSAADGPQSLARWLFLKGLWRSIVEDGSDAWQRKWVEGDPVGAAIERLVAGASAADLTVVVRQLQILALYDAVQLLDHPAHGIEDLQAKITENVEWRIASYAGEAETLGSPLGELHGEFLRLDPAGRMGEPASAPTRRRAAKATKASKRKPAKSRP